MISNQQEKMKVCIAEKQFNIQVQLIVPKGVLL
jgi:hypothetical protein